MERDTPRKSDAPKAASPWHWRDCQIEPEWCYPTSPPPDPKQGEIWHDEAERILYVWSGAEWVEIRED
jgi:hypothetical protein